MVKNTMRTKTSITATRNSKQGKKHNMKSFSYGKTGKKLSIKVLINENSPSTSDLEIKKVSQLLGYFFNHYAFPPRFLSFSVKNFFQIRSVEEIVFTTTSKIYFYISEK